MWKLCEEIPSLILGWTNLRNALFKSGYSLGVLITANFLVGNYYHYRYFYAYMTVDSGLDILGSARISLL